MSGMFICLDAMHFVCLFCSFLTWKHQVKVNVFIILQLQAIIFTNIFEVATFYFSPPLNGIVPLNSLFVWEEKMQGVSTLNLRFLEVYVKIKYLLHKYFAHFDKQWLSSLHLSAKANVHIPCVLARWFQIAAWEEAVVNMALTALWTRCYNSPNNTHPNQVNWWVLVLITSCTGQR